MRNEHTLDWDRILRKKEKTYGEPSHNKYVQIAKDFIALCPQCKSSKVTIRKRKTPKYLCHDCGNEFDDPKSFLSYTTRKQKYDFGRQYSNPDDD